MINYSKIFASRKLLNVFALFAMQYIDTFKFFSEKLIIYLILFPVSFSNENNLN